MRHGASTRDTARASPSTSGKAQPKTEGTVGVGHGRSRAGHGTYGPCPACGGLITRARVDERDRLDLQMTLHTGNSHEQRQIPLVFPGVQYLDFSQAGVETGIDRLSIEAVSHREWDEINYDVHNPGQLILTFCCP